MFSLQSILLGVFAVAIAYALVAIADLRRRLAGLSAPLNPAPASPKPGPSSKPAPADGELPPELIAVIAAAIQVTLGGVRHRVVSVSTGNQADRSAWSVEGRRQVFQSHNVR